MVNISKKQMPVIALFAILMAVFLIIGVIPQSVVSSSQLLYGTSQNPIWQLLLVSQSYGENIAVLNSGTAVDSQNVLTQRLNISLNYNAPIMKAQFDNANAQLAYCYDLSSLSNKPLGVSFYKYISPDNPSITQTAKVKIYSGASLLFDETMSITGKTTEITENGIVVEPQWKIEPTLVYSDKYLAWDSQNSYLLDKDDMTAIKNSYFPDMTFTVGGRVFTIPSNGQWQLCPLDGNVGLSSRLKETVISRGTEPPAQTLGGVFDYSKRTFDATSGILTMPASGLLVSVFTISIPKQIGDQILWAPILAKPKIQNILCDGGTCNDISFKKITFDVCNDASYEGAINIVASAPGTQIVPSSQTLSVSANSCSKAEIYVQKSVNDYSSKLTITAYSRENSDTKTIDIKTSKSEGGGYVDPCVAYPELCEEGAVVVPKICENQIPFIQKTTTQTVGGIFGFFGTQETTCAWDYGNIALILFFMGLIGFLYGDAKGKEDFKKYSVSLAVLGIVVFAGVNFFESTFLSYFGGNGVLLLVFVGLIVYLVIKGIIR